MADIVDSATRSRMMAGIKGCNTRPERVLRKGLHALGFRYGLNRRDLPGKPDIVLPKYRAVIFVHGCFWHRHAGCRLTSTPATRPEFWQQKFTRTVERDQRAIASLQQLGWRTGVIWECALRGRNASDAIKVVAEWLRSSHSEMEYPSCLTDSLL